MKAGIGERFDPISGIAVDFVLTANDFRVMGVTHDHNIVPFVRDIPCYLAVFLMTELGALFGFEAAAHLRKKIGHTDTQAGV